MRPRGVRLLFILIIENSKKWSGRRDLNPRPSAWEADTLPLSYARNIYIIYYIISCESQSLLINFYVDRQETRYKRLMLQIIQRGGVPQAFKKSGASCFFVSFLIIFSVRTERGRTEISSLFHIILVCLAGSLTFTGSCSLF